MNTASDKNKEIYPAKSGITIYAKQNRKGDGQVFGMSYQVVVPAKLAGKKRQFFQSTNEAEARQWALDRYLALKKHGTSFSAIPGAMQLEAVAAWEKLKEHGIGFLEAADAAIRHLRPEGGVKTVAEVVAELVEFKKDLNKRNELTQGTLSDFTGRTEKIVEAFGKTNINEITDNDVRGWLTKIRQHGLPSTRRNLKIKPLGSRSILNYRNAFGEVLKHAYQKRYCNKNPMDYFTAMDNKLFGGKSVRGEITHLKVADAEKLLAAALAQKDMPLLPALVLRLFCGIRTAEVCKLEWSEIRWKDKDPIVCVPAGKAKKRHIRNVDIPNNAIKWLALCAKDKGQCPIVRVAEQQDKVVATDAAAARIVKLHCKAVARLANSVGVKMDGNTTRHSFGTYHFALHGDSGKTSGQLGHRTGDYVLFDHYRALANNSDAERYFSLVPNLPKAESSATILQTQ